MFYIQHNSDNFTIIDCDINDDNADEIIQDIKSAKRGKGIERFICTHPDEDHFGGLHLLDDAISICNFYVVKNQAIKMIETDSFKRYCKLRNSDKAFYIYKGCTRRWMNLSDNERKSSGISILWPDTGNPYFQEAFPQIIIIGEAPSRHLNYYTGYHTVTQNKAGDITMDCTGDKVNFYVSKTSYTNTSLTNEGLADMGTAKYIGSISVETEYTL